MVRSWSRYTLELRGDETFAVHRVIGETGLGFAELTDLHLEYSPPFGSPYEEVRGEQLSV